MTISRIRGIADDFKATLTQEESRCLGGGDKPSSHAENGNYASAKHAIRGAMRRHYDQSNTYYFSKRLGGAISQFLSDLSNEKLAQVTDPNKSDT